MQSATETRERERELNSLSLITTVVILVIVTMTFGSLIAVFFVRAQNGYLWKHIQIPSILWLTTGVLIASSFTVESARRKLQATDQKGFFRLMVWSTFLGLLFLAGQIAAWLEVLHSGVILEQDKHSWFIFLFSGLHGLHIVAGIAGLGYLLWRTREPAGGPKYQMTTRAAARGVAIFWHYLDFLWVVLFVLLLTWRR